jgi:hypothetical protein
MLGYIFAGIIIAVLAGASTAYLLESAERMNNPRVTAAYQDVEDSMQEVIKYCESTECPELQYWIDRTCYVENRYSFCK